MKPIIPPIDKNLLLKELTKERFIRNTNYGSNEIYVVSQHDSPNVLKEIGRLREVSFRASGGGTGLDCDLDSFDTNPICYKQLVVWNPAEKEIVGGYRFILIRDAEKDEKGNPKLSTSHYFNFSEKFVKDYAPYTIELGRSFVQPLYQPSAGNRKGLFSLDNLWDGLASVCVDNPDQKYLFGKMTMYKDYNQHARDMLLYFLDLYFPDKEKIVVPKHPLGYLTDISEFKSLFKKDMPYKEAHAILNQSIRKLGENIPPLFNSYMNISPSMKTFGTADNHDFGSVEETGILVTIADIYPSKKERHIVSYKKK
ncbi:MAG: GNAT family N-acetyltransferase [Bacteroidetes bacterium]|nr:GNAT family N-acetyltransferase [Bacteroidota bacterium]